MSVGRGGEGSPLGSAGGLPYSKGLTARALIAGGVSAEQAYELARLVELEVAAGERRAIEPERFEELAVEVLGTDEGPRAAERLRRYTALRELDLPVVLLVGGATGTGKSTVATEAAHRLGITRVTSTDFIRETMRAFLPREVMPSVHFSSFEAEESVTDPETGDPTIDGFLDQTRNVLVGVDAAIERALTEGWSMVLEGVHLVPGMVRSRIEGALVVHVVLHIENEDVHRLNFQVRDAATGGVRPMERYLSRLGDIRRIQDFLVARSEANGVPVLEGTNPERATAEVMELVLSTAGRLEPVR